MAKLQMDSLQKPYAVSYQVKEGRSLNISASFGAMESHYSTPYRRLKVDLRIGSPAFDNTNYTPDRWRGYRPETDWDVSFEGDSYDSLRYSIWAATDKAYKQALETYSKKKAYKDSKNITEVFEDRTPEPLHEVFLDPKTETLDENLWKENIRSVSAVFLKYPAVSYSQVSLIFNSGSDRFLDSEGTAFKKPDCQGRVTIEAGTYTPDGFILSGGADEEFCLAKDAPALAALIAKAEETGKRLSSLDKSVTLKAYIGPVLFKKEAAGLFFSHLLAMNISNPREVWATPDRWSAEAVYRRAGSLVDRLGMRVLSPFLSVSDDPFARYYEGKPLIGGYEVDDEGVPARKLKLVEKGKLLNYFMSRSATRDFRHSNGHGRADLGEYPAGSPSNIFIQAADNSPKAVPETGIKARLISLCREQELDYCLMVRELDNLSDPFIAYKVYVKDGREEPVHGIEFTGTSLRALRDIAAASKELYVYYPSWNPPGTVIAPSILVQEMEVKKTENKPEKRPYLRHPYFDR
jgi:predicted Zn-dependent protease